MRNLKLTIEYNGAEFFGWQKQKNCRTVQEEIEKAFLTLTGENVSVEVSGRTDKGVHALGQVASVQTSNIMPTKNFKIALNDLLPKDIFIKKLKAFSSKNIREIFTKKKEFFDRRKLFHLYTHWKQ